MANFGWQTISFMKNTIITLYLTLWIFIAHIFICTGGHTRKIAGYIYNAIQNRNNVIVYNCYCYCYTLPLFHIPGLENRKKRNSSTDALAFVSKSTAA